MVRFRSRDLTYRRFQLLLPVLLAGLLLTTAHIPAYAQAPAPCLTNLASPLFVPVAGTLSELIIDDQCEHIYLTNQTNNSVEVFSLRTGGLQAPIQVGSAPSGLDTSPDGKTLYVANSGGNNISVVDLIQGIEKLKVPVPAGFSNDRPFSLAVAKNGLVLFSTTFAGSGFGGRMLELDPLTNTVSKRPDFFVGGSTTEATFLRASGDRSAVGAVAGDISSAPVFKYSAAANLWGPEKDLNGFVAFIALDQTGATTLVNPGTYVLDANLNLAGTIPGGSFGVAVDPAGAIGYQVGPARIDVLNLAHFTKTGSLDVGDTLVNASAFGHRVGELAISRDGSILAVITDHGFSIVRAKVCAAGPTALCLNSGRFRLEATWRAAAQGTSGLGQAVPMTSDTGAFWFFDPTNLELVVKVLDGRSINGKFWVFYGSLTNVEFTLTVTDTQTGTVKTYFNPQGQLASVADTSAF